jgi:hypothetical protein
MGIEAQRAKGVWEKKAFRGGAEWRTEGRLSISDSQPACENDSLTGTRVEHERYELLRIAPPSIWDVVIADEV